MLHNTIVRLASKALMSMDNRDIPYGNVVSSSTVPAPTTHHWLIRAHEQEQVAITSRMSASLDTLQRNNRDSHQEDLMLPRRSRQLQPLVELPLARARYLLRTRVHEVDLVAS